MNKLKITYTPTLNAGSAFCEIDAKLNGLKEQSLEHLLWSNDGYKPKASFTMAHNGECVFLKYNIHENNVRAIYNNTNDPVYEDSCVEFFISMENDTNYYNLEFNCLGTCTIGYGDGKFNRICLPDDVVNNIRSQTKLERANKNFIYEWGITLAIPISVFIYHQGINLTGKACRLNFYKCGDDLPQPHFIAWNNIESDQPNFHLSEFFGTGVFLN
jgi:hypothetical protein